jgi:predicted amidohydrolase
MSSFQSHLNDAASLPDLARILGSVCLEKGALLQTAQSEPLEGKLIRAIEAEVEGSPLEGWEKVVDSSMGAAGFSVGLITALEKADAAYPIDCLAVLRGLCPRLHEIHERHAGEVVLDRGSPIPFAIRPIRDRFKPTTTYQKTQAGSDLLRGSGARLFEYSAGEQVRVSIDYRLGAAVDELGWGPEARLPRIATLHPPGSTRLEANEEDEGAFFFDARPQTWDPDHVLDLLRQVADVEIALLPELSIGDIDAVEREIARSPGDFPRLIVAGSIHLRESRSPEVRANESRVYLDGRRITTARKHHAYEARELNGKKLEPPARENLSPEQKTIRILSGRGTRLAVVICADALDTYIPAKLQAAGVNLLLIPSFTSKPGSFTGPPTAIATACQGVTVIANAPPADAATPFHGIAAVPRPQTPEQTITFPEGSTSPTEIAVVDPNLPMSAKDAVQWR